MAGGAEGRSLEETPTWAVAVVCFVLVLISIIIEHIIHLIGKWLLKRQKGALFEALEKLKSELMLLGFISLLLSVGQEPISKICISEAAGASWHPCKKKDKKTPSDEGGHRRLLFAHDQFGESTRRVLAAGGSDKCAEKGKVAFISSGGIHQLHIFIFVLAIFHVLYCIITWALGRAKMKRWKKWEMETRTINYQFSHDPERFRFARDTSFGRRHLNFWSDSSILLWIVCFLRQFFRSVPKVDYLTLRHGFITAHMAPQGQTRFNFQKYINRSLEEDFKVVVGINPIIWFFAVLFLLCNTHGWYSYLWLPFIPLIIVLVVGTKLQVIITKMGLRIQDRGEVVRGTPLVEPGDDLFWFGRPRLILYLIQFVLFQNAFQLAFLTWASFEYKFNSCFHERVEDVVIRITMGVFTQILCSYVTLPLYALVTQMGSTMKSTVFNERVATALRSWHHSARKHTKTHGRHSSAVTPLSSMSPVHLLHHHRNETDSVQTSPRKSSFMGGSETDSPLSPYPDQDPWSTHHSNRETGDEGELHLEPPSAVNIPSAPSQHEIYIDSQEFSFGKMLKD